MVLIIGESSRGDVPFEVYVSDEVPRGIQVNSITSLIHLSSYLLVLNSVSNHEKMSPRDTDKQRVRSQE